MHSHPLEYPFGSGLQQVTAYHHKDDNNYWIIERPHQDEKILDPIEEDMQDRPTDIPTENWQSERHSDGNSIQFDEQLDPGSLSMDNHPEGDDDDIPGGQSDLLFEEIDTIEIPPPVLLKHGDIIRLRHWATGRNLHCNNEIHAYLSKSDLEVSGFGNDTMIPDTNDHWIIEEVFNGEKNIEVSEIRNIFTLFRLKHSITSCYLASSKGALPDWASNQFEVSCELTSTKKTPSKYTIWNFETNFHSQCEC